MKAKVTSAFIDAHDGKAYRKGAAYEADASRIAELEEKGFVQREKAPEGSEKKGPAKEPEKAPEKAPVKEKKD